MKDGTRSLQLVALADPTVPLFRAMASAAAGLLDLPVPARWTFTLDAGAQATPCAHLTVTSIDDVHAQQAEQAAVAVLRVTAPWATWVTAVEPPHHEPLAVAVDLVTNPDVVDPNLAPRGPDLLIAFWSGISTAPARSRLTLALQSPGDSTNTGVPQGRLTLSADTLEVLAVGATLAAGLGDHDVSYRAVPHRPSAPTLALTTSVVGRCLSGMSLIPDGWDARPAEPTEQLLDRLTRSEPPHTAVFGGSGLGKTTLIRAMVKRRLAAGGTVFLLDPHGDLAAQVAVDAHHLDAPVQMLDFGDPDHPPRWSVTRPPQGVHPRAWVGELLNAIQAAWPGADAQWFGPVYRRAMAGLLLPLVLDPDGPWPLSRVLDMALPGDTDPDDPGARWRTAVLDRLPLQVRRDAVEAVMLMDRDRDGHARTWLLSKLEPLLQHPGLQAVIDHKVDTVDLASVLHGRSVVAALPASALGDEGSTVLSLLLMRSLWGLARRGGRRPVDLILDEAHRMPAAMCQELLAEGRKFGLQVRFATQSPAALTSDLRTAILTNVGTVSTFRVGPLDATHLGSRLTAQGQAQLSTLRRYQVLVSTDDGHTTVGVGPVGDPTDRHLLRRLSRAAVLSQPPVPHNPDQGGSPSGEQPAPSPDHAPFAVTALSPSAGP